MYDNSLHFAEIAETKTDIIGKLDLKGKPFILATVHRDTNTDYPERLNAIFSAMLKLSKKQQIVLPLHPRTEKMLKINLDAALREQPTREVFKKSPISSKSPASSSGPRRNGWRLWKPATPFLPTLTNSALWKPGTDSSRIQVPTTLKSSATEGLPNSSYNSLFRRRNNFFHLSCCR